MQIEREVLPVLNDKGVKCYMVTIATAEVSAVTRPGGLQIAALDTQFDTARSRPRDEGLLLKCSLPSALPFTWQSCCPQQTDHPPSPAFHTHAHMRSVLSLLHPRLF